MNVRYLFCTRALTADVRKHWLMNHLAAIFFILAFLPSIAMAQEDRDAQTVYRMLSSRSLSERRVVFRNVTPEMRAALWRVHVRHFLDSHPELTPAQHTVIAQFLTLFSAELYRAHTDDPEWDAMFGVPFERMKESASAILTHELFHEALDVLGPLPAESAPALTGVRTASMHLEPDFCVGCYAPDCECNLGSDWCFGGTCSADNCKGDSWGCGTGWQKPCNGMCH